MGKEISLIAFLDEVVSRNTQHHKSDFELDAQKLRDFFGRAMATRYEHIMQICLLVSKPTALSLPGSAEQLLWAMW